MQSSLAIVLSLTLGFSPHPCVSIFGTGHIYFTLETFLGSSSTAFRTRRSFPYASRLLVSDGGFACHPDISLAPALPAAGCSFLSPSFLHIYTGTGISTCCPSTTPFGLALGPDLPRADQLYSGNLGYSAWRIPTSISLLIPAFSLPCSPQLLTVLLLPACNAPLPTFRFLSFGGAFQPRTFSAQDLSTSELLRTL